MRRVIKNRKLSWTIRLVLVTLALITSHGVCYLQGICQANRRAAIRIANDDCAFPLFALEAAEDESTREQLHAIFKEEIEASSATLARMCLQDPQYIERKHYNLLLKIKESGEKVDPVVDEAIRYLESIHDMDEWGVLKPDELIK